MPGVEDDPQKVPIDIRTRKERNISTDTYIQTMVKLLHGDISKGGFTQKREMLLPEELGIKQKIVDYVVVLENEQNKFLVGVVRTESINENIAAKIDTVQVTIEEYPVSIEGNIRKRMGEVSFRRDETTREGRKHISEQRSSDFYTKLIGVVPSEETDGMEIFEFEETMDPDSLQAFCSEVIESTVDSRETQKQFLKVKTSSTFEPVDERVTGMEWNRIGESEMDWLELLYPVR